MLEITINEQSIASAVSAIVVSDAIDFAKFKVQFPKEWDGLTNTAVFYNEDLEKSATVVGVADGTLYPIPASIIANEDTDDMKLLFSVFGVNSAGKRATSSVVSFTAKRSGLSGVDIVPGETPEDPDILDQFMQMVIAEREKAEKQVDLAKAEVTKAADHADAAGKSKTAAETAKGFAETAATEAETKAKAAAASARTAEEKATDAAASAAAADKSKTDAETSAETVTTKATEAANSAEAAKSSQDAAARSAQTAAQKATEATESAAEAGEAAEKAEQEAKKVVTPHIGVNGNWYIGDQDTGVKAEGEPGQAVVTELNPGLFGFYINADGHLILAHNDNEPAPPIRIENGRLIYEVE